MAVESKVSEKCPACGSALSREGSSEGVCPACVFELALESPVLLDERADPDQEATAAYPTGVFSIGQVLGRRYSIRGLLGQGGMGEVWRATDLKLRVDVALKALRPRLLEDPRALEALRQEVRAAREVISPNACRVFDLVELDGRELVSMEYIDGTTLLDILRKRSPLDLVEAREIACQFLVGLQAIHDAGLVHRDVKPENLMVTRSGRVVLMDFGIAKGLAEGRAGTISGTPAYMAPEHARGEALDARADVFAAGVVLVEMIAPGGVATFEKRRKIWQGIHQEPPRVPASPWAAILTRAVSASREQRHGSAAALARALEEVTLRVAGAEDLRPYPGLAAFTEADAEYFFGRELEVEEMWKKLQRPHLLGLIGPSGAGKSSFLRAGLLPVIPSGWRAVVSTPGNRPMTALARALVPELAGDTEALQLLTTPDDSHALLGAVARWRSRHGEALLIVDQFEELFAQNPPETQSRFSELLGRLAVEADVHVLLSMRDDFLAVCSQQESLKPIFSELTPLKPLTGVAVRRALVQPAVKCGYRFAEESLVDEMVGRVGTERGALPMLAFAAARLWDHRDRDQGLLTREAYEHTGGVAGALAQHAEATMERIGEDRVPVARELFRNLVTAQGTRAARERGELLSVFDDQEPAEEVLATLIDARLLTSYEVPADDEEDIPHQRIEIVHESLLSHWPRLVRWQTQDADSAQLRDQIRQAAQIWVERGRPEDLLWTGTSFGEYQLWKERYEGGLSTAEDAFGEAMVRRAERRKRRRRLAVSAVVLLALALATIMGGLWQRSEAEARRAEASKLLALAQLRFEDDPTEALAYTTASLELSDTEEARVLALRFLWEAPPALEVDGGDRGLWLPYFSPDGTRLATAGWSHSAWVWSSEGGPPVELPGHEKGSGNYLEAGWYTSDLLLTGAYHGRDVHLWKLPEGERLRTIDLGVEGVFRVGEAGMLVGTAAQDDGTGHALRRLRSWTLPEGQVTELGTIDKTAAGAHGAWLTFDGKGWVYLKENQVFYRSLPPREGAADRLVGFHENRVEFAGRPTRSNRVQTLDAVTGEMREWDLSRDEPTITARIPALESVPEGRIADPSGRWAVPVFGSEQQKSARIWDLESWPEARPLTLRRSGSWFAALPGFHPRGKWLVVSTHGYTRLTFWPLEGARPRVVDGYEAIFRPLEFSPDGRWLATLWPGDGIRLWPLPGSGTREVRAVPVPPGQWRDLAFDPDGDYLFVVRYRKAALVVPLDGSPPRRLEGVPAEVGLSGAAVSPSGRFVATAFRSGARGEGDQTLCVWDLEAGRLPAFEAPVGASPGVLNEEFEEGIWDLAFADDSTLYTSGVGGIRRWDLDTGQQEVVLETRPAPHATWTAFGPGARMALVLEPRGGADSLGPARVLEPITGESWELFAFAAAAPRSTELWPRNAFDTNGTVAAVGDPQGVIRVVRLAGGEPHLLVGHEAPVDSVAISPDGRWIASSSEDNTLRLWPVPDLDGPPLHTLPRDELIARLESLTNIRVVRDPESAGDWTIQLDPFPGWEEVPTWQ